jgi:hypothetical protein
MLGTTVLVISGWRKSSMECARRARELSRELCRPAPGVTGLTLGRNTARIRIVVTSLAACESLLRFTVGSGLADAAVRKKIVDFLKKNNDAS